jgi:hypothetical protein
MAIQAFPVNPTLSAVAIAFRNPESRLIADRVLPRVPVATKPFKWTRYGTAQGFTVPNTMVGSKSEPNMVDFGGTEVQDQCADYGLDDLLSNDEIGNFEQMDKPPSGGPIHPRDLSVMMLTSLIQLDREIRVANTVFGAANYGSNTVALAGTSRWDDFVNSNPVNAILVAADSLLVRPNKLVLGRQVWTVLRQHPAMVQAVYKTAQNRGVVSLQMAAEALELEEILIGEAWVNTARRGQAATYNRAWGKSAALIYSSQTAAQIGQPSFGWTAQFGNYIAGSIPEPKKGLRGGELVRVGETVKEVIAASECGYLFQTAIA